MADYLADVKKYDAGADAAVVDKIVKHLGIALRNRDSSLVAASDQKELDRVRDSWGVKKLGVDAAKAEAAVAKAAKAMAADHLWEGIRVNCVNPGTADTPWIGRLLDTADDPAAERAALEARQPHGRLVSAQEVADAVFAHIKQLYSGLQQHGRRGIVQRVREQRRAKRRPAAPAS